MTSELLIKRLLTQASVSVLAGLLLSSAAMAEENAVDASGEVTVGVDVNIPDVGIDPPDFGGPIDSNDTDANAGNECEDCSRVPDISIDPVEMWGIEDSTTEAATSEDPTSEVYTESASPEVIRNESANTPATSRGDRENHDRVPLMKRIFSLK